jgi:hypothetical protein
MRDIGIQFMTVAGLQLHVFTHRISSKFVMLSSIVWMRTL